MRRCFSTAVKARSRTSSSTPTIPTSTNYYCRSSPPFHSYTSHFISCPTTLLPHESKTPCLTLLVRYLCFQTHYLPRNVALVNRFNISTAYFANNICWLIDRVFSHALNTVNKIRTGVEKPPGASRVKLYGLYKQSMGAFYFRSFLFKKVPYH